MSNIITRGLGQYNFVITRGYGLLNRFFDKGKAIITGQTIPPKTILKNTPDKALLKSDIKINPLNTKKSKAILKTKTKKNILKTKGR